MDDTAQDITTIKPVKKLAIGWFSFTCSEDSTILLTELLNDNYDEWKHLVEFRYAKALKTKNKFTEFDVAFVEGAISGDSQEEEVKKIREKSNYVVAVGACACTGMPSASRNDFDSEEISERIQWYLSHFDYTDKVKKLEDVIKVDGKVEGCPMNVPRFMEVLTKYLKEFGVI